MAADRLSVARAPAMAFSFNRVQLFLQAFETGTDFPAGFLREVRAGNFRQFIGALHNPGQFID